MNIKKFPLTKEQQAMIKRIDLGFHLLERNHWQKGERSPMRNGTEKLRASRFGFGFRVRVFEALTCAGEEERYSAIV